MSFSVGNQIIQLSGLIPALKLLGTESGALNISIRENAGIIEIYNLDTSVVIMSLGSLSTLNNVEINGLSNINGGVVKPITSLTSSASITNSQSGTTVVLGTLTADSTLTLPTPTVSLEYLLVGDNTSSYVWSVTTPSGTINLPNGNNSISQVLSTSTSLSYKVFTDGINWYIVSTTNLNMLPNYTNINKSGVSEVPGLSTYGTGSVIDPDSSYYSLIPHLLTAIIGGTVGTSEIITAQPTITYNNSTAGVVLSAQSLAAGATGNITWDLTSIAGSYVSGGKSIQVSISASSSASSTSATIVGNIKGLQFV